MQRLERFVDTVEAQKRLVVVDHNLEAFKRFEREIPGFHRLADLSRAELSVFLQKVESYVEAAKRYYYCHQVALAAFRVKVAQLVSGQRDVRPAFVFGTRRLFLILATAEYLNVDFNIAYYAADAYRDQCLECGVGDPVNLEVDWSKVVKEMFREKVY